MKVGYLHSGPVQHGIRRYSQLLAHQARRRPDLTVIEADADLSANPQASQEILAKAAKSLAEADVIHIQYSGWLWGNNGRLQLHNLRSFFSNCSRPLVVTFHDIYLQPSYLSLKGKVRRAWHQYVPVGSTLRQVLHRVEQSLVCTDEEAQQLNQLVGKQQTEIIPHFVESRSLKLDKSKVRTELGLDGTILTVLGWIHPDKGHQLVVEALPEMPSDVKVIFAGRPSLGGEAFGDQLQALAKEKGVSDRLHITGYLSEEDLERYLVATDLAICPFKKLSASGSMSTWISVARPILASNVPQIEEYNRLEPGAIKTFAPYTPSALATKVTQILSNSLSTTDQKLEKLRQQLDMTVIFDQHLEYYRQAIARAK